jgi:hypothetical protein
VKPKLALGIGAGIGALLGAVLFDVLTLGPGALGGGIGAARGVPRRRLGNHPRS